MSGSHGRFTKAYL